VTSCDYQERVITCQLCQSRGREAVVFLHTLTRQSTLSVKRYGESLNCSASKLVNVSISRAIYEEKKLSFLVI
jgi:hypothetical protein